MAARPLDRIVEALVHAQRINQLQQV